jgi:tetratricopeptide (TPR) repeat protein
MDLFDSMLEAEKYDLMVRPSVVECGEGGPELVEPLAVARAREAEEEFEIGQRLMDRQQFGAALEVFQELRAQYAEAPAAEQAREAIGKCQTELAGAVLKRARKAMEEQDYQRCVELCDGLVEDYPEVTTMVQQAQQLAERARQEGRSRQREIQYRRLAGDLEKALQGGNLPRVRMLLKELNEEFADYEAPAPLMSGEEMYTRSSEELEEREQDFEMAKRIFEHFLEEGDEEKALEKFTQLEEPFPDHPEVEQARDELRERGWLQQEVEE